MNYKKEKIQIEKKCFEFDNKFYLESGDFLNGLEIAYTATGKLNANKSNVVWICHALTANADPFDWWKGLVGKYDYINPQEYYIVCANIIGSCYGTTGPLSKKIINDAKGFSNFPIITIRDMVLAHIKLANHLGINEIGLLIGGSLGGQQALEWSIIEPERIKKLFLIATNVAHSPYGIAFNEAQRLAIEADNTFKSNTNQGGLNGMKAARAIALISYRTYSAYNYTQVESENSKIDNFKSAGYQKYQGDKLAHRFNAYSYYSLSKSMDSHNVGRGRGGIKKALQCIKAKTIVVGISSDILFPVNEQIEIAENIPYANYYTIESFFGHDGFLIETKKIEEILKSF